MPIILYIGADYLDDESLNSYLDHADNIKKE